MTDLYTNRMGNVLVVAPSHNGRLAHLAQDRQAVLNRDTREREHCIGRWLFADVQQGTLTDQWGNTYDHQVRSLLAGSVAEGEAFLADLEEAGFAIEPAGRLFVPLQKLDAQDEASSDQLRQRHSRAFAIALRERPSTASLVTALQDSALIGD